MARSDVAKTPETSVSRQRDMFAAMREDMDRLFSEFERGFPRLPSLLRRGGGEFGIVVPDLDVRENADTITIEAELPGVDEKNVTVTVANGLLTIKGEKKQEKEEKSENYHLSERSWGAFERSLRLPDTIDETRSRPGSTRASSGSPRRRSPRR